MIRHLQTTVVLLTVLYGAHHPKVSAQPYTVGQATWFDNIMSGFCGFGGDIPPGGFVAAWPFIETGPGGAGAWQPGLAAGSACGQCVEVSCVPSFVENSLGTIYLDRTDACKDPNIAVVVKLTDECRCSHPDHELTQRGNFDWCCNVPTPRLGYDRHIDLSKQSYVELVKGGDAGIGIIGIKWRPVSCDRIGVIQLTNGTDVGGTPGADSGGSTGGGSTGGGSTGGGSTDGGSTDGGLPQPQPCNAPPSNQAPPPTNPPMYPPQNWQQAGRRRLKFT